MDTSPRHLGDAPEWADANCRAVLEAAPDAMLVVNRTGEIVAANQEATKLWGYSREHLIGSVVESLLPARLRDRHRQHRENFFANPEMQTMQVIEIFAVRSDASEIPVDVSLRRLTIGTETFAISAVRDTTARVRAEELRRSETILRESEEHFRLVADSAPVLIWMSRADKLCIYFNKPWLEFTGRSLEQELGNGWAEGVHPEDLQRCLDTYTQSFDRREKFRMEYRLRRHDGEYRWMLDIGVPRLNSDGSFAGYIGIGVDVTERKRTEEALHDRERELTEAQRLAGVGSWQWEPRTDTVIWSKELYHLMGIDPTLPAPTYKEHARLFASESWERLQRAVQGALQTGTSYELDLEVVRPESIAKWEIARGEPVRDKSGQIVGLRGTVQDITERKRAEEVLREYEEVVEVIEDRIMVVDREYRYVIANAAFLNYRGFAKEQIIDHTVAEIVGKETFKADIKEQFDECFQGKVVRYEVKYSYPKLGERNISAAYFPIRGPLRIDRIACVLRDITERKRAEEALRESENKLRLILDSTAEAIYRIDLEHRCTFCNPACLRTLGYEHIDQVLGKNMHDLLHHSRGDGTVFPVEECRVHQLPRTGEGVHVEGEVFWRANGTSFPVEYWSYPQRRGEQIVGTVVAFVDITERKLAEAALANVTRKLIDAQEQERARIGGELHDDIGQRLALLALQLQQLQEDSLILPEVHSRMGELQNQVSEIATDIQSLSHELHSGKLQYLGIAAAMRGFCQEFADQQKVEIAFNAHDLPSPLSPEISLCLFRVLQEALHNSAKHSGVKHFEARLWGTSDEIHLTVKDSGAGFDHEAAKESRGLGLISMEERVKLLKGTLSIDSQPKRGTSIEARVPLNWGSDSMRAAG